MSMQGLATIGIEVKVANQELNYVTEIGDIGGTPSELDATCFKDSVKKAVPGVQENKTFEVTYLFDNSDSDSDFRRLRARQDAGSMCPVLVTFPDGSVFAAVGYVNTYVVGAKVDELITAKLLMTLQSGWNVTNPSNG